MATQQQASETHDLLTGAYSSMQEAEVAGMARILSLIVASERRDFPSIVGRVRRVIEAARAELASTH
ncbi:TPA: hypothetical protein QDB21_005617 [Burkholderia vietnamiensis]|nr:hypothetical protein [Burkholderia vietnamiensis]